MKTKAAVVYETGKPIEIVELDLAGPEEGEVLIRYTHAGLCHSDVHIAHGDLEARLPMVLGHEGAGIIEEVGPGVTRVKPGDRVALAFWERWTAGAFQPREAGAPLGGPRDGVLAEQVVAHEDRLVVVPETLSDVEAASLPCAGTTAWNALVSSGHMKPGDTVLVQGTGGVSIFALQIAKLMGARVIATSSSDKKLERLRALGAAHTINYKKDPEWGGTVRQLTGGQGVDHVVETGGPGTLAQSIVAVRTAGRIHLIGTLTRQTGELPLTLLMIKQARLQGLVVGSRRHQQEMVRGLETNGLKPVLDRSFPLESLADAFRYEESGQHFGKICIEL